MLAINRLEPNRSRRSEPASYAKALRSLLTKLSGEAEAALGRWPKGPSGNKGIEEVATIQHRRADFQSERNYTIRPSDRSDTAVNP